MCKEIENSEVPYTDGREEGRWETRYPDSHVQKWIIYEAVYLIVCLIAAAMFSLLFWLHKLPFCAELTTEQYTFLSKHFYALTGGMIGGISFGLKWLVHVVAHGYWNEDRRYWRFLLPLSSATISLIFIVIVESRIFNLLNPEITNSNVSVLGLSFLIGLFSDRALVKLSDVANSLFGPTEKHEDKRKEIKRKD